MMHVVIDDRDAARAERACVSSAACDVVEQTEPHRAAAFRVMAGRPHHRHRRAIGSGHHALDRVDRGAGGEPRDFVRLGRRERVRVERHRATRCFRNATDVIGIVHARELLVGRGARRHDFGALPAPAIRDGIEHFGALRPFGMARRRLMLRKTVGVNQDDRQRIADCRLRDADCATVGPRGARGRARTPRR